MSKSFLFLFFKKEILPFAAKQNHRTAQKYYEVGGGGGGGGAGGGGCGIFGGGGSSDMVSPFVVVTATIPDGWPGFPIVP